MPLEKYDALQRQHDALQGQYDALQGQHDTLQEKHDAMAVNVSTNVLLTEWLQFIY